MVSVSYTLLQDKTASRLLALRFSKGMLMTECAHAHALFLMGERKLSANTREQQRRTETAEKRGLMKNIMTVVPARPTRLVCHEKYLNDGLQKGETERIIL